MQCTAATCLYLLPQPAAAAATALAVLVDDADLDARPPPPPLRPLADRRLDVVAGDKLSLAVMSLFRLVTLSKVVSMLVEWAVLVMAMALGVVNVESSVGSRLMD
jgi:hypothetical protein